MTAQCTITRPGSGSGTTDGSGNWTPATSTTVYTGPCSVQPRTTDKRVEIVGEEQITTRAYIVALPYDVPEIHIGDQATVTDAADAGLVGRTLSVLDVQYDDQAWQRDLVCQDNLG